MSTEAQRAGHAILAILMALIVTGVTLAFLLTLQLVGDDVVNGRSLYFGEILSTMLYLLILGTALTVSFGALPFALAILILMRLRARSLAAFALGGAVAGAIAAIAFIVVVSWDTGKAMEEFRKLALEDLTGVAVLVASAIGVLAARRYLIRRNEVG